MTRSISSNIIKQIRTYFRTNFKDIETRHEINFEDYFSEEINILREFERDQLVTIDNDGFALTEIGRHFSPQVASVFDAFHERALYNENIAVSVSAS